MELRLAIDEWNGANVRLQQIEGELEVNRKRLEIAEASLRQAQTTVEERLVSLYKDGEVDVVEVVLGATSFDDMIDGIDTANRVAEDDARIVEAVKRSKAEVQHQRKVLERAHARQEQIVAQRADRRAEIEQGLAEREALYESVKGEIAQLEAEERARQTRLAAQARRQAAAIDAKQAQRENQEQEPDLAPAPAPSPAPSPEPSPAPSPPPAGPGHPEVVSIALRYLGVPYRWGRLSARLRLLRFHDVRLRQDRNLAPALRLVAVPLRTGRSRSQLAAGDLVFFNGLGHVGIYIGGGRFVHAPHTGDVVKISSIWDSWYRSSYVGARRL